MKSSEITKQIAAEQIELDKLSANRSELATQLAGFDYTQGSAEDAAERLTKLRTKDEIVAQRIEVSGNRIKQLNKDLIQARRHELIEAIRDAEKDIASRRDKIKPNLVAMFDYDAEPMIRDVAPIFPSLDKLIDMTSDIRRRKREIELMQKTLQSLGAAR